MSTFWQQLYSITVEQGLNTNCTIYTFINKQRIRPDGTARLYTRITIKGGGSKKIPLPFYWPVQYFDFVHDEILPRFKEDPDFLTYTALIKTEQAKYWRVIKNLLLKEVRFTIKDIIRGVNLGDKGKIIVTWMLYKIKERLRLKEIKERTAMNHRGSAQWILQYRQEDVEIGLIDPKWINKYTVFLLKRMAYSGAWSRIKDLKAYIKIAESEGIAIHEDFKNHFLPEPEHEPVYLEKEEMDALFKVYKDKETDSELKSTARAFLFDCFTGLRVSDLKKFHKTWIENDEIVFSPTKRRLTDLKNNIVRIPLIPIAKEFVASLNDESLLDRSEGNYNKKLKILADLAGINKVLTSHVARHSFATQLAVLGVPVIVISKLLGHKNIKSTMVYIHIADKIRKREMDKLQNAFSAYTLEANIVAES